VEVVGIDIGFGYTKASNGKKSLVFKSIYGEATNIQFREHIVDGGAEEHLHIEIDGEGFFVGELAERQSSDRNFTLDQDQLMSKFAKILSLAALSRLVERNEPVKVVTGLPVKYFTTHKARLTKELTGRHTVIMTKADGTREETVINVGQVRVIPQPFGSMFNLMLNDAGETGDKRFLQEKIGVIDIGFRTADYSIANRTKYLERGSRSTDSGISQAFALLGSKLQEISGVNIELYRLFDAVEKGSIKIRGKNFELGKITEHVFAQLAEDIANEVNRLWADEWDIDSIVLSGGGGSVLAPYLTPLLEGEIMSMDDSVDARYNNVHGYTKYAKFLWTRPLNK